MKIPTFRVVLATAVLSLFFPSIMAGEAERHNADPSNRTVFRVALFPWIPDAANDGFASLRNRMESEFEKRNPEIDLVLRLKAWDESYYNPAKVAGWLASAKYDLVEIDTIILGDLVNSDVIEPWETQSAHEFFPAAAQGSTIVNDNGVTEWWGLPHLLCGYFLVSKSQAIDSTISIDSLRTEIQKTSKPLVGNFDSSWDLPSLYLDAGVDNGMDPHQIGEAIRPPLNPEVTSAVQTLADLCETNGGNPCVDGTYSSDWDGPVVAFSEGSAIAFWGYSERLHLTVKKHSELGFPTDTILVNSIPLGSQVTPLLFSDAFVKRAGCSQSKSCQLGATAFAEFINSDWALAEILLSRDAESLGVDAVPRYLLPAKASAYDIEGIRNDRFYQELEPFARSGYALPNSSEMYERRRLLGWLLNNRIQD